MGLTPGSGISTYLGCGKKKKEREKERKQESKKERKKGGKKERKRKKRKKDKRKENTHKIETLHSTYSRCFTPGYPVA